MKSLGKIIRSVQAFGRGLSGRPPSTDSQAAPAIGIALGGGFARGVAHVGVLKVLEEENIPISFIAGTSVGALIGAAYCSGVTIAELEQIAARVRFKHFASWTLSRYGFASNQRMIGFLSSILKVRTFEELHIPLAVTATDFSTGDGVVFHSGPLVDPVRASCAYPGMFLPVKIRGRLLVDGMLAHAVPSVPLREMGAERVLAVHLKATASVRCHWPVLLHCAGDELRRLEASRRPGHPARRQRLQVRRLRTQRRTRACRRSRNPRRLAGNPQMDVS